MLIALCRNSFINIDQQYILMEAQSKVQVAASSIQVLCLGAGQDVGRSCVCVTLSGKTIMFDVGIHMLYSDHRRYPDFSKLFTPPATINDAVHLVVLTHFHLDHCGALPYLTQHYGYNGPIICSTPTKALLPLMLEDYRKVTSEQKKQQQFYVFSVGEVKNASAKVKSIGLFQTIQINGIKITSYYAGHVLGACMYHVEYNGLSVVYTGDYNSYADRHLGAASAPRLAPNLLITQTTYATTIRDTKRDRQKNMLQLITETVDKGGKVLIPVFALGRAQQLSVLLESYWKRTDSNIPIYFSPGLIEKANLFYRLFVDWQNEKIKEQFSHGDNMFQFKKVKPFDKSLLKAQMPYVLFATPGMLHGGTSMQVFKQWCGDEKNTLIIPGYCVEGTLGNKLLKGIKQIVIDKKQYDVKMRIANVSFSAHADAKGIINLLRNIDPQNIMFVHGDKTKMEQFAPLVFEQLKKPIFMPANFQNISIPSTVKKQIILGEVPDKTEGYLISSTSNSKQYCLIQEEQLMEQINRIMLLAGNQQKMVIQEYIECEFHMEKNSSYEELIRKYENLLRFTPSQLKKQEEMKGQEGKTISIVGRIQTITSFLKELKALKRRS